MASTFKNKKIIIAGASSGIGLATALQLSDEQAIVTVTGRNAGKLKAAEERGLHIAAVDSSRRTELDDFFKTQGKFDHLVIALGSSKGLGNFAEASIDDIRQGFEEKYWSHLNTVQASIPYLQEGGSITLITAITATAKMPGTSGIGAANGALEIMVPIWAKELKQFRINAVSPGVIDTPWWDFLPEDTRRQAFAQYATQIPLGRVGRADEVAGVILFLMGNEYMTGKVVGCDGGMA